MVASRRHLPDLRSELRGRQRRRHRRPERRAEAPAVPGRPGRRRHLVHPLVRVASRRRRIRRGGLPGHRPVVRVARRSGTADLGGPDPGHPDDRGHRPEPRFGPAPLVPGGPRIAARLAGKGQVLVPSGPWTKTATRCRMAGCPTSPARPGREREPGRHSRRVVPPSVLAPAARPQLEPPRRPSRARGSAQVLVRPRRGRRPDRFGGTAW